MKIHLTLYVAAVCLNGLVSPLSASNIRTSSMDIYLEPNSIYEEEETYQVWTGPGWYYGIWFNDEDEYYDWVENHFYDLTWTGPGWYYGIWFDDQVFFESFRQRHRYYGRGHGRGNHELHRQEQRGTWRGDSQSGRRQEGQASQQPSQRGTAREQSGRRQEGQASQQQGRKEKSKE